MLTDFPRPCWVDLRTPEGKLLARFDVQRGIIMFIQRGEPYLFDLAQLVCDAPSPPPPKILTLEAHPHVRVRLG